MTKVEVRPATRSDIDAFYGVAVRDTIRAWVGVVDGEVAAIGGIRYAGGMVVAFGDFNDVVRGSPVTLFRSCLRALSTINPSVPVYAGPAPEVPAATRFLVALGFHKVTEDLWRRGA